MVIFETSTFPALAIAPKGEVSNVISVKSSYRVHAGLVISKDYDRQDEGVAPLDFDPPVSHNAPL